MTPRPRPSLAATRFVVGALLVITALGSNLPARARCVTVGVDGNVQQVCDLP